METIYDVIVIGAGAAGMIAAARAAELGGRVLLLEKMERAGRKILISGKGRCNITNTADPREFLKHIHPDGRFLRHAFSTFFSQDILRLLHAHGCETNVERGGRIFPVSNKAADVVAALLQNVIDHKVEIRYRQTVEELVIHENQVQALKVRSAGETQIIQTKNIILCTGGKSYPATGSDGDGYRFAASAGHAIITPRPALVPIETEGNSAQRMSGLALRNVSASVWVNGKKANQAFGEMTFTDFGVSGPIILSLSRNIVDTLQQKNRVELALDLKPALDENKLDLRLTRDLAEHGKSRMDSLFRKWLPAAMIPVFLEKTNIPAGKAGHQLTAMERRKILNLMKNLRFTITGCRPFKEAIITAGGITTSEIDPLTMRSKFICNLYFAGEVIDLDADTGGYNLQIAFSTAWLAATACMKRDEP